MYIHFTEVEPEVHMELIIEHLTAQFTSCLIKRKTF